jgi:BlaI family transcriptional regulator, penicillinase repressor
MGITSARTPGNDPPPLSEGQMQIMHVVWDYADRGGATVGEVWEALSARRRVARNTVQTLLVRLEEKGWLTHRVDGSAFRYLPKQPRAATLKRVVRRLVDTAFAGSAEGLVMALLQGRDVTRAEADRIRALLDAAERGDTPNPPAGPSRKPARRKTTTTDSDDRRGERSEP